MGVVFIAGATFFAQRTDVAPKLQLDLQGLRTDGRASPLPGGGYRLSYTHPSGTIYSRSWKGNFGVQRPDQASGIAIAYSPERPENFQPATVSYVPGLTVMVLTIAGMSCILYANRRLRRPRLAPRRVKEDRPGQG